MSKWSNGIRYNRNIRALLRLALATLTGLGLFLGGGNITNSGLWHGINSKAVTAQVLSPQDVWREVYRRLPDLPLENQYISQETGEVASNDTLISRLIRYHIYVKNRPPSYRFDWKQTLGDYLGVNDYLVESKYPGSSTLRQNPMEGDRAAIQNLSRVERNALVDVLASLFNPNSPETEPPTPRESSSPLLTPKPTATPRLPQPGDAELLKP
ncbi:hypothetical protein [Limnofasciculus baicalensis]|uniref:Uncharacterized protein n=1 Tax=Limnofasciculus baicalensis BBK-W-15 TaxID=2699891 RepID=A0AAE3KQU2_9CYAN|nr:hypothetical protein [Limnofasciculus baicalensis]MCP2731008.1 hypothetical protein [Limnofasciculus baicalensis BBK-W-15]